MSPIADWYVNQVATYGFFAVAAVQGVAVLGFCYSLAAAIDWIDDRQQARSGIRAAERHANHPAERQRKEKP